MEVTCLATANFKICSVPPMAVAMVSTGRVTISLEAVTLAPWMI